MYEVYTIAAVRQENATTRTYTLDRPLAATAGQFVMVWLPGIDEKPFSIVGSSPLTLTIVAVGPFTEALGRLAVGDHLWVRGPLGQGYRIAGERLLLVGGGYGVAPLLFLAREAIAQDRAVEVCVGARNADALLLVDDLRIAGAAVYVATEDGSRGQQGLVTAVVEQRIAAHRPDGLYACGPAPMLGALETLCQAHSLPHQLSWEALMRCGQGVCGSCECHRPGWLACVDGPVAHGAGNA